MDLDGRRLIEIAWGRISLFSPLGAMELFSTLSLPTSYPFLLLMPPPSFLALTRPFVVRVLSRPNFLVLMYLELLYLLSKRYHREMLCVLQIMCEHNSSSNDFSESRSLKLSTQSPNTRLLVNTPEHNFKSSNMMKKLNMIVELCEQIGSARCRRDDRTLFANSDDTYFLPGSKIKSLDPWGLSTHYTVLA